MNQSKTPKAARRYEQPFDSNLNIKRYDSDNLYPNNILLKVADSPTASGCLSRYIDFIEGNGIKSTALSACEVNRDRQTLDDIHALVAKDKATFDGFAILIQYDIYCRPCAIYHQPFEQCRLEEADDKGNINHIVVHPDWAGNATRGGNRVRVDAKNVKRINVFNPDPAVVAEQIAEAGGITNYLGQIYYHSGAGHLVYPKPKYDSAITDISTDTGVSNVMNRNARSNFLAAGVYTYYASAPNPDLEDQIDALQGDINAASIISVSLQNAQERPEFTEFKAHNFDKDFTATTAAMTERIYSAFGQEGWHCLRIGKIGFSGDLVGDIEKEYAKRCKKDQRVITKAYFAILSRFADGVLPEQPTLKALTIEPYSSIETQIATL
jgi:hypothetical protein